MDLACGDCDNMHALNLQRAIGHMEGWMKDWTLYGGMMFEFVNMKQGV